MIVVLFSNCALGQTVVPLISRHGVYWLPCRVNGHNVSLILDTGASSVSISMNFARKLFEEDLLDEDDIIGEGRVSLADASVVKCLYVNLRDVEIGGFHLKDVRASVLESMQDDMLLGQSALQQLGPYTISGNQLIIAKSSQPEADGTVASLRQQAERCLSASNYIGAIRPLEELRMYGKISPHEMSRLVVAYARCKQYDKCIATFQEWTQKYRNAARWDDQFDTFLTVGEIYIFERENYQSAVAALSMAVDALNDSRLPDEDISARCAEVYALMGKSYLQADERMEAASSYSKAVYCRMASLNLDYLDIFHEKSKDRLLGEYCYSAALLYPRTSDEFVVLMCSSQRLGNKQAESYLDEHDIFDRYRSRYREWIEEQRSRGDFFRTRNGCFYQ